MERTRERTIHGVQRFFYPTLTPFLFMLRTSRLTVRRGEDIEPNSTERNNVGIDGFRFLRVVPSRKARVVILEDNGAKVCISDQMIQY